MSWIHAEQRRCERYVELLQLLRELHKYLFELQDYEAIKLANRIKELLREPL